MTAKTTPETRALLDALEGLGLPPLHTLTPEQGRDMRRRAAAAAGHGEPEPVASVRDVEIEGPGGPLALRLYEPEGWAPGGGTLVYFHGGGWVLGNLDTHDALARGLANASGLRVVATDYRLAPEHPHPAALEDAWAAVRWARSQEEGALLVGGDSAGGHLATCVAARARGTELDLAGQLLIYPVTDLASFETPSYEEFAEGYWLTRPGMAWFRGHYVPASTSLRDPDVSPLYREDLTGLPPAVIMAAECDVLRDEGAAYARRLEEEGGCQVTYRRYQGVIHGFMALAGVIPEGRTAIQEAGADLRKLAESAE
jgi:acetyl esterase